MKLKPEEMTYTEKLADIALEIAGEAEENVREKIETEKDKKIAKKRNRNCLIIIVAVFSFLMYNNSAGLFEKTIIGDIIGGIVFILLMTIASFKKYKADKIDEAEFFKQIGIEMDIIWANKILAAKKSIDEMIYLRDEMDKELIWLKNMKEAVNPEKNEDREKELHKLNLDNTNKIIELHDYYKIIVSLATNRI